MTRRVWIIVTAVTLTVAAIGGAAALAGGGAEAEDAKDASPSLGMPAPGFDDIDETEVSDGSGLDVEILPKYDGPDDGPPITEGPTEEPGSASSRDADEAARDLGAVTNGELADNQDEMIVGDGPLSNGMTVPGFEGFVTDTVVVSVEPDSPVTGVDTP